MGLDPLTAQIAPSLADAQGWLQRQLSSALNFPMKELGQFAPSIPNFGLALQGQQPGNLPPLAQPGNVAQPTQFNPLMPLAALTGGGPV